MYTFTKKIIRSLLALILAIGGLALTRSHASAAAVPIDLCAVAGTATLTGSFTVPIWGWTLGDCSGTPVATLPGPLLTVNEGDTVTITVHNALPSATAPLHAISFEIPGITFDPGPTDAATGASVTVTFTASAPGIYLYQSGGDAGRQEAMGLYGALIVRPTSAPDTPIPGQAYHSTASAYDVESILVLSQVDPLFNATPDTYSMYDYKATYWLINGKAYPDTASIAATAGQKVLLRYVNAGYDNTTMMLLGMHENVVARDANLLNNPFLANAETIPAGGTEDAIATVPSSAPPVAAGFALYNRQLHDGMMTFIQP